jgi:hypothetical protein
MGEWLIEALPAPFSGHDYLFGFSIDYFKGIIRSGFIPFLYNSGDDPAGCIMLVQRM